jgi:hypothetical protein
MRKLGPVGISVLLSLALLALGALGVAAIRSGSDGAPPTAGRQTQSDTTTSGDALPCPGGGQVQPYYNLAGGEFSLVGRLASIDGDGKSLLVKGPTQYIHLGLADNARVEGTLTGGLLVKASGSFDSNGNIQATTVELACGAAAVAVVTPAPTAFPEPSPSPRANVPAARPAKATEPTPRPTGPSSHSNGQDKPAKHHG